MDNSESPESYNVVTGQKGGLFFTRNGTLLAGSTNTVSKVSFAFAFNKEVGTKEFILSDSSIVLTTTDFNTYTFIRGGLNTALNLEAIQVRNKVWVTNGSDAVFTWDGSTVVVLDGQTYSGLQTPNVPPGKYSEYYHGRVWIFNLATDNSALRYSAVTSTDGLAIAPDDYRAWPGTQQLGIGQGDGSVGTGLKVYNNQLFPFKERSIYTIVGTDEFTYFARKTDAQVGTVSNDSIVLLDNFLYFLGEYGIYQFNGSSSQRISDKIADQVLNIQKDTTKIVNNVWDTQSQFNAGATMQAVTATVSGLVQTYTNVFYANPTYNSTTPVGSNFFTLDNAITTSTHYGVLSTTIIFPSNFIGNLQGFGGTPLDENWAGVRLWLRTTSGPNVKVIVQNRRTGEEITATRNTLNSGQGQTFTLNYFNFDSGVPFFTGTDINSGNYQMKIENAGCGGPSCSFDVYVPTVANFSELRLWPNTTGQYISQISTITPITAWGAFNTIETTNGGLISYYFKTATSVVNITTYPYIAISPGSVIASSSSNNYIQWATTITSISTYSLAYVDRVTIQHIEGQGAASRAVGIAWKNNFWLNTSTEAGSNASVIFMKALMTRPKPNAFSRFYGINIRSLLVFNGNLYGGSSTDGKIYRLDYGTNDNGAAISWAYETPNLYFEQPFFEKDFKEILIEAKKNNGTLSVGFSVNGGTFTTNTVNLTGSGRLLTSIYSVAKKGKFARFRFSGNDLDKPAEINSLGIFYALTQTR